MRTSSARNTGREQNAAALRAQLARVREESGQALAQLRGELDALRASRDSMRDVDSVTERVMLEQELDTIRHTLHEKERQVDSTAAQCRRLEDELEDQHLAYDGLKHDLDRKKLSLTAAREQAERVSRERQEIEDRYLALLSGQQTASEARAGDHPKAPLSRAAIRFTGVLTAGILLAAAAFGVWVLLDPLSTGDPKTPDQQAGVPAVQSTAPQTAADELPAMPTPERAPESVPEPSAPVVLGTVGDRLSDGSTGPPMVLLKGGEFTMGRRRALPNDDAGPAREVLLDGFLIGATEVTFEEYDRFVDATGRRSPNDFGWGRGRRPVVDVSWEDARAYAQWLSRRTDKRYRLPSEAEWEYAAAAGTRASFWWGYETGRGRAACFDCGSEWDNRSSAPVGSFYPNPLGLQDTAGNVMEWVEDCYHPNYFGAPLSGQPRGGGSCRFRVARGGAFNKPAKSMRATTRNRFAPETRINYLGFRLARDE